MRSPSLERGELVLYKQNFIIQDLVKDVFESLVTESRSQAIYVAVLKKDVNRLCTVYADKEKIRQVLTNLVENSIKYSKEGGNIVASMYNTDGKHILVEISDDGIGIKEKHVPGSLNDFTVPKKDAASM